MRSPGAKSEFSIRDAVLLKAWCLYGLEEYETLEFLIQDSIRIGELPEDDFEVQLIRLWIDCRLGRYEKVVSKASEYIRQEKVHSTFLLAEYLFLRGRALAFLGQLDEALEDSEAALAFYRLLGSRKEYAEVSNLLGIINLQISNYVLAIRYFDKSAKVNSNLALTYRLGENHLHMGITYYKLGIYSDAYSHLQQASKRFEVVNHLQSISRTQLALGNVCRLQGEYVEARKHLMEAYGLATKDRMPREECLALEFLGDVYRDEGKPDEARRYYARGMAIAQRIAPKGDLVMELQRREGECLMLEGREVEALPILARARTLAGRLGDRFEEGVILRCLASASAAIRDWDAAEKYQREGLRILEEIDARHEMAIGQLRAAEVLMARAEDAGQARSPLVLIEDAWQHMLAAQHIFLKLDIEPWLKETRDLMKRISRQRADLGLGGTIAEVVSQTSGAESGIIAVSSAMRGILQLCEAYAQYDEPVLITGETGTGKELVAHRIHALGGRRDRPLVAVNVSAIPSSMFERELFGHRRGAFSGADQDRPGFVAEADAGSLFLDEIADLPLALQPKLLRLIQERTYMAIGDPKERVAKVRLIAATNANLEELVRRGRFRRDLYYRLRVLEVHLPPLRKRRDDIVPLMNHFLSQVAGRRATISEYFDEASQEAIRRFSWPGNVREVAMVARRAHIGLVTEGRVRIQLGLEPPGLLLTGPGRKEMAAAVAGDQDVLRSRILVMLEETGGNKSETARRLGISRPTLYRWLSRFGIDS